MSIHCACASASFLRILNNLQRVKWASSQNKSFLYNNKVLHSVSVPISRIICTDSKVQSYETEETEKEQESVYLQDNFLKENFNINDTRFYKLVTIPHECNHLEEILWTNEFKDVLSRSSFHYDVNVHKNSKLITSHVASVHSQDYENIFCTDKNALINNNKSVYKCDKVYTSDSKVKGNEEGKASEEQLLYVINRLTYSLINFFEKPQDYSIYHQNIVFQNNIKGVTIRGLKPYIQSMYIMRFYGYLHFSKVKVEILKITHHIEDGTVRVRWRVNGLPRHKLILLLISHKKINWQELPESDTKWLDGFSVFNVGGDGLIYKHVCDKMIPDDDFVLAKKADLRSKVLGLLGLRTPSASTLNTLLPCCKSQGLVSCKKLT